MESWQKSHPWESNKHVVASSKCFGVGFSNKTILPPLAHTQLPVMGLWGEHRKHQSEVSLGFIASVSTIKGEVKGKEIPHA